MWYILLCLIISQLQRQVLASCNRIPMGANGERSPVDENFKILIDGNPTTYIPEHQYNVSLSCPVNLKFISFTLVVENEEPVAYSSGLDTTGHFELFSNSDTRFSAGCENMIENTNTNAKTRIDVSWVAPKQLESGCVVIKAGVVQHRDVWFIDDGFLTKRICPEEIDEINSLTPPVEHCCACDEAKYEILLERKWARNTHAKNFPSEGWRTRIGELIGASHSYNYRYWAYGGRASQGVQELAEHGASRTLEQEIRDNTQNGYVRTIIKAPGIPHRVNAVSTTLANARVDPQHHQISLTAKVDPSPDWILGVAGLELCLSNCTWIERKVLNLYPWDIGTDSGASYMSADQPQVPPDVIRRITSSYPSDHRSPFYDDSGAPMKPLATLYLTRKKLYIRECEAISQEGPLECATHPWNEWSNCSTRCGAGWTQRTRSYKSVALATNYNCVQRLQEVRECQGTQCGLGELSTDDSEGTGTFAECELGMWSDWSPCSKSCGRGISMRTRDFLNVRARARCIAGISLPLEETRECTGTDCGGAIPASYDTPDIEESDNSGEQRYFGENIDSNSGSWNLNREQNQRRQHGAYFDNNGMANEQNPPKNRFMPLDNYNANSRRPAGNLEQPRLGNRPINYNDYALPTPTPPRFGSNTRAPTDGFIGQLPGEFMGRQGGITVGGMDASNYNVVQDYCFEKPYASTRPCLANPVIVSNYWFYDHEYHECKLFTTDNCDENKNRFRTLESCEGTCRQPQTNLYHSWDTASGTNPIGSRRWNYNTEDRQGFTPMSQTHDRFGVSNKSSRRL